MIFAVLFGENLKLFYKISLILIFALLISFGIFYFLLFKTVTKETLNGVEEIVEINFIKTVKSIKKEKLYENPKNMIKKITMLEKNQNFLNKIFILDDKNTIIFASNVSLMNKPFSDIYKNVSLVKNKFNDKKYFYIVHKLTKNKKVIGIYDVDLATHVIGHLNDVFLKYIILFVFIFFIIIFFLINIILIKPIKDLETITRKITSGNLDVKLNVKQNDELGNLAEKFNDMAKSLNKVLSEKNTLLRVLSHDLTNQIGSSYSLIKTTLSNSEYLEKNDLLEYLSLIAGDLENAQKLINFTKKFIAIESGKIELELRKENILNIIKNSISTFKNKAQEKGLEILLKADEKEYPAEIDSTVFRYSVIDNLLSNAVKFSIPGNDIFIELSRKEGNIDIKIINIGEYIPGNKINKLFSLTEKTTSLGTRGEKGTGFGLPIVYKFVKLMNASIDVESEVIQEVKSRNIFTVVIKDVK